MGVQRCQPCQNVATGREYVAIGTSVMYGDSNVAVARGQNMATRIANALNRYTPNARGQ